MEDHGNDVKATGDGGIIIVGTSASFGSGGTDIVVYELDRDGNFKN